MSVRRVVIAGAVGAGKSTFVQTVGELGVIQTEEIATGNASLLKETTTVALDFGRVTLAPDLILHVYGTPGQFRFNFMWEILIRRVDYCLLLVAAHRPVDFLRARQILAFIEERSSVRIAIGLTHSDCLGALPLHDVMTSLGFLNQIDWPLAIVVNPTDRPAVMRALTTIVGGVPNGQR